MTESTEYFRELSKLICSVNTVRVGVLAKILHRMAGQALVIGNGGSAATASHFAADISKAVRRVKVISLGNLSALTAIANDVGYEYIFSDQLKNYPDAEVLIAISTSGESENIINAVKAANALSLRTVGLTGFTGGELARLVDLHINVPSGVVEMVEDAHMAILHSVVRMLKDVHNVPV